MQLMHIGDCELFKTMYQLLQILDVNITIMETILKFDPSSEKGPLDWSELK